MGLSRFFDCPANASQFFSPWDETSRQCLLSQIQWFAGPNWNGGSKGYVQTLAYPKMFLPTTVLPPDLFSGAKVRELHPELEVNCWRARHQPMRHVPKSTKASGIVLGVFAVAIAWLCFQLGTHRHTGILRTLAQAKDFLSNASASTPARQQRVSASAGPQHSVSLSWKASTSAVVGYNVYRRGTSGVVKINSVPVTATTFIDGTVQPGQTYFYVTKAVSPMGKESSPSNEVRVTVPSP